MVIQLQPLRQFAGAYVFALHCEMQLALTKYTYCRGPGPSGEAHHRGDNFAAA